MAKKPYYIYLSSWDMGNGGFHVSAQQDDTNEFFVPVGTAMIDLEHLRPTPEEFQERKHAHEVRCAELKVAKARMKLKEEEDKLASLLALPPGC